MERGDQERSWVLQTLRSREVLMNRSRSREVLQASTAIERGAHRTRGAPRENKEAIMFEELVSVKLHNIISVSQEEPKNLIMLYRMDYQISTI